MTTSSKLPHQENKQDDKLLHLVHCKNIARYVNVPIYLLLYHYIISNHIIINYRREKQIKKCLKYFERMHKRQLEHDANKSNTSVLKVWFSLSRPTNSQCKRIKDSISLCNYYSIATLNVNLFIPAYYSQHPPNYHVQYTCINVVVC